MISIPSSPSSDSSPSVSSPSFPVRRVIPIEHNFELFQLILVYFYTRKFCFTTSVKTVTDSSIPTTFDAEGIYEIAECLKVESLKKKAVHFLQATCNVHNITPRVFGVFAKVHQDLSKLYDAYFQEHWDEVKESPRFEEYFIEMKDPEESRRINTKFRSMIRARV